jgi:APA family basic amino acid/polyamine antiporter
MSGAERTSSLPDVRRLSTWAATAMVVTEVIGVGIFLTPATMVRTLGTPGRVLAVWAVMGAFSAAGALCYAELATRFPKAGGGYVFLREAFGPRTAFVYGWMALLVMDPGLTAALGIGLAQYSLATVGAAASLTPAVAVGWILLFGVLTLAGLGASARLLRWTATAKLAIVGVLVVAGLGETRTAMTVAATAPAISAGALASTVIAAFFAFGGWWDLGKMSEEVANPRRTLPRALVGGVLLVATLYALVSVTFVRVAPAHASASDDVLVSVVGATLFGEATGRLLAAMVAVAVAGSLAAVLLGAPRVYLAMARDGLFPARLATFDPRRGSSMGATLVQVSLGCVLAVLGTFDQILGYFVPAAIFFLGLSASAVLVLPRPGPNDPAFRAPWHPLPIAIFLVLIVGVLALFVAGQPLQTALGAAVVALGVPVAAIVLRKSRSDRRRR